MKRFHRPSRKDRLAAIGDTSSLPISLRRALEPGEAFTPIRDPSDFDWLAQHEEGGQTFEDFRKAARNAPTRARRILYLQPLGAFEEDRSPSLGILEDFAFAFFGMPTRSLDPLEIGSDDFAPRVNPGTGKRQILTEAVIRCLRRLLPRDAFCLLGLTMEDLYPDPTWNFVFGEACLRGRTGVFSLARYDRRFFGLEPEDDAQTLLLRRSLKVLAHETAHMFGLLHCIYYECVMNGSNHLDESDEQPLRLCPVCLRKLQSSIRFDVSMRYETLRAFYERSRLAEEATWVRCRQEALAPGW